MGLKPVLCENCGDGNLVDSGNEDGDYVCENATEDDVGASSGCGELISASAVRKMRLASTPAISSSQSSTDIENAPTNVSASRRLVKRAGPSIPVTPGSGEAPLCGKNFDPKSFAERMKARSQATVSGLDDDIDSANCQAMMSGEMKIERVPLMTGLSIKGHENPNQPSYLRSFVKPRVVSEPTAHARQVMATARSGRVLGARMRPSGYFGGKSIVPVVLPPPVEEPVVAAAVKVASEEEVAAIRNKDEFEPLVVWKAEQLLDEDRAKYPDRVWADKIEVPPEIAKFLRPHQREGVKFMAECVLGLRRFKGNGAILADDMGLGKTLQSISLLYTLLSQGFEKDKPIARRIAIITPTSLVNNWKAEIAKWLQDKIECVAVSESSKADVIDKIKSFLHPRSRASVIIIAYDTFRLHSQLFMHEGTCDLMICDEAHKLKNARTAVYEAMDKLECPRRILLSGTPLQNNLDEFYAMINFTNRGVLGDRKMFRKYYEMPIMTGREPFASDDEQQMGLERSAELSAIVNQFVLRRTNSLLSKHLPSKVTQIVCCRPTTLQSLLYSYLLSKKDIKRMMRSEEGGARTDILPLIGALKQLCNHPKLIWDALKAKVPAKATTGRGRAATIPTDDSELTGSVANISNLFRGTESYFQKAGFDRNPISSMWSGKMYVLERLLMTVRKATDDRVVIVSNSTSALDVIGDVLKHQKWDFLRLDGSTSVKKRQQLVDQLTARNNNIFCFLLSSRAGGCGLNLIGANRLILFDPDWNPAVDKQAAARVWRDGQTKRCYVYRFLTTGTIEEKVYQRQLSKEGLAEVLGGGMNEAACSSDELRQLFDIRSAVSASDTHDHLQCDCLEAILTTEEEAKENQEALLQANRAASSPSDESESPEEQSADALGLQPIAHPASDSEVEPDDEPNASDNDFIAPDDGDNEEEDFGPKKKTPKKKKEERKRRALKQSLVVDPLKLQTITKAMIGQRGTPPDEELINWAHHITGQSAPDPLFRDSQIGMKPTASGLPFVSFVFSSEVTGKQIGSVFYDAEGEEMETEETISFLPYSARCPLPPVEKLTGPGIIISADDALAKHQSMVDEHERKKRKKMGVMSDDEDGGPHVPRRQSARAVTRVSMNENSLVAKNQEDQSPPQKRKLAEDDVLNSILLQNSMTREDFEAKTEEEQTELLSIFSALGEDEPVAPKSKRTRKTKAKSPVIAPSSSPSFSSSSHKTKAKTALSPAIAPTPSPPFSSSPSPSPLNTLTPESDQQAEDDDVMPMSGPEPMEVDYIANSASSASQDYHDRDEVDLTATQIPATQLHVAPTPTTTSKSSKSRIPRKENKSAIQIKQIKPSVPSSSLGLFSSSKSKSSGLFTSSKTTVGGSTVDATDLDF